MSLYDSLEGQENECEFVSSRGIVKSCDIYPNYNHQDRFDISYLNKCANIQYGDTVYLHYDILRLFIKQVHPQIKNPYVIVCGSTDLEFPREFHDIVLEIELSDKILNFWCQNCTIETNKIKCLPIGLDYHCMSFNTQWLSYGQKNLKPIKQEQIIKEIKSNFKPLEESKKEAITNFHLATDLPNRAKVRVPAYQRLKNNTNIKWLQKMDRYDYYKECENYQFMISPSGNGLDTHRTWEALILDRIPIVNDTGLLVYNDLPIIQLQIGNDGDGWEIITKEYLESKSKDIIENKKQGKYNIDKLKLSYWMKLINQHKKI